MPAARLLRIRRRRAPRIDEAEKLRVEFHPGLDRRERNGCRYPLGVDHPPLLQLQRVFGEHQGQATLCGASRAYDRGPDDARVAIKVGDGELAAVEIDPVLDQ